jgi:hypothetical protein
MHADEEESAFEAKTKAIAKALLKLSKAKTH